MIALDVLLWAVKAVVVENTECVSNNCMSSTGDDVGGFHQSWPRAILAQDWWHFFSPPSLTYKGGGFASTDFVAKGS